MSASPVIFAALALFAAAGCRHHTAPAPRDPNSFDDTAEFASPSHGFSIQYPSDWRHEDRNDADNVFSIRSPRGSARLGIIVPRLPAHIPGFIPLGPVQSGYVDDLKKKLPDVKSDTAIDVEIPGAKARRFTVTSTAGDGYKSDVLLITRGDTLYIVPAEADAKSYDDAKKALDLVAASWK